MTKKTRKAMARMKWKTTAKWKRKNDERTMMKQMEKKDSKRRMREHAAESSLIYHCAASFVQAWEFMQMVVWAENEAVGLARKCTLLVFNDAQQWAGGMNTGPGSTEGQMTQEPPSVGK